MLPLVENKRIFAGLRVSRLGWLLHNAANDLVWVGRAANYAAKLTSLPSTYTYITESVYKKLADEAKTSNGTSMWEAIKWNTFNDQTIYRSSWGWRID